MKNISSYTFIGSKKPFCGKGKKGWLIFLPLFFIAQFRTLAQLQTISLGTPVTPSAARVAATNAAKLPFFDDFSYGLKLNTNNWSSSGGTLVNNDYATNHPTINMLTFDGLKADGNPYNFVNSLAEGPTDTLTSQVLDLSNYLPADSLYLSFFWQNSSLGDKPNTNDSLRVQFLTNGGIWQTVWVMKGDQEVANFQQVLIPIRARNLYFHNQFQFRFQSFGRQSGQFDIWNIDYVYLNTKRNQNDKYYADLAVRRNMPSLLKRYRAMPVRQFMRRPTQELNDSLSTDVVYLNQTAVNNFFDYDFTVKDLLTNTTLQKATQTNVVISPNPAGLSNVKIAQKLATTLSQLSNDKYSLQSTFALKTTDEGVIINRKQNDTIRITTEFSDYYAYDDGTAEAGAYLGKGFGRIAAQFTNNSNDVVSGVRINLLPMLTNLEGNAITIQIMENDKGKPGNVIRSLYSKVSYSKVVNGFIEYTFDPVAVKDTFYIGVLQFTDGEPLIIGLDKNSSQFSSKYFYNLGTQWVNLATQTNNADFKAANGALMMRPIMGGTVKEVILGTEKDIQDQQLVVFPNPAKDYVSWNDPTLRSVELVDFQGQSILKQRVFESRVSVENLNSGIYLLLLSDERNTFVRKISIVR